VKVGVPLTTPLSEALTVCDAVAAGEPVKGEADGGADTVCDTVRGVAEAQEEGLCDGAPEAEREPHGEAVGGALPLGSAAAEAVGRCDADPVAV
jgi:hypothetical protein